jgi:predicted GIY-YIG superfamily endonuclease
VSPTQLRLLPDAQPLVERLGRDFFRSLPSHSGVYRFRDASDAVIYVGKAKNLRQRLSQYRVANPEQLPRRTIRLLHTAVSIDWEECPDESAALARERELLLALRPRFNRAGVWPGRPWFLVWRFADGFLELVLEREPLVGWEKSGPWGGVATRLQVGITRLLWLGLHSSRSVTTMPLGWFEKPALGPVRLGGRDWNPGRLNEAAAQLVGLFECRMEAMELFAAWLDLRADAHPMDLEIATIDLEWLADLLAKPRRKS